MNAARDIDDVIERLELLATQLVRDESPLAYFPVVYRRVTQKVKLDILARAFHDNVRMDALVTAFANRYFEALQLWREALDTPHTWRAAFARVLASWATPVEHLLLSMHAHISVDLPAVLASQIRPGEVAELKEDYDRVGDIFVSIGAEAQTKVSRFSGLFTLVDWSLGNYDEKLFLHLLKARRAGAWREASTLASMADAPRKTALTELDARNARWALGYVGATLPLRLSDRLGKRAPPATVVAALREMRN